MFAVRFSEDGAFLASCESTLAGLRLESMNKWFRIFDYESGAQVWAWNDNTTARYSLADIKFSPDNTTFATADCYLIRLWDRASGREVLRLKFDESNIISSIAYSPDGKLLAAATYDGDVWICPLTPPHWKTTTQPLDRPSITSLWTQLTATDNAPNAYRAIWTLAASPETVVPFLAERLAPVPKYPLERIRQLIADLDDDSFSRREAATRELSTSGIQAELLLGECLSTTPSPEVRRRVNSLLENLKPVKTWIVTDASLLRTLRAIRVLQRIGNPEARALLEKLAAGASHARQTQEAKTALKYLERLNKR